MNWTNKYFGLCGRWEALDALRSSMIKKIEKSTNELADNLAKLEKRLFGTAWDSVVINNKINNGEFVYWVFEQDDQIVGYLATYKDHTIVAHNRA